MVSTVLITMSFIMLALVIFSFVWTLTKLNNINDDAVSKPLCILIPAAILLVFLVAAKVDFSQNYILKPIIQQTVKPEVNDSLNGSKK